MPGTLNTLQHRHRAPRGHRRAERNDKSQNRPRLLVGGDRGPKENEKENVAFLQEPKGAGRAEEASDLPDLPGSKGDCRPDKTKKGDKQHEGRIK